MFKIRWSTPYFEQVWKGSRLKLEASYLKGCDMVCFEVMVLVKGWVAEVFSSYQIPQKRGEVKEKEAASAARAMESARYRRSGSYSFVESLDSRAAT
ncbi:MAG: hypothetical protein QXR19_01530 [Candidatus Jordarchaeaceae archaeon]